MIGGILADEVNYRVAGSPCGLASADFDVDGVEDLVVACPNARSVAILLGQMDGTFAPATYFDVESLPGDSPSQTSTEMAFLTWRHSGHRRLAF
jgi:hypothetical protein